MDVTIPVGWWLIPLTITVASFAWAIPMRANERPTGHMFDGLGYAIGGGFRLAAALILSLLAWLVWSLVV